MNERSRQLHNQDDLLRDRTISDFGDQWMTYTDNNGYYASQELFKDILNGLIDIEEFRYKRVIDIGSGTGRIVQMVLRAGANRVTAVEPSKAFFVLKENISRLPPDLAGKVEPLHCAGDDIGAGSRFDIALSIGVLHHIPHPDPVVRSVYEVLEPGGKFLIWLYGREGNRLYLLSLLPLRELTKRLPHRLLVPVVWMLYGLLVAYRQLCRFLPLPLKNYLTNVLFRMNPADRRLVIYDQLNPAYAKYYTRHEAEELLRRNGFTMVASASRRGYSWTVMGTKG